MRLNELLKFDDIVIQCHDFPDADALASGYGIYAYLKSNGKTPLFVYGGKSPITKPNLIHMIEMLEIPAQYETVQRKHKALVTVDCCCGEGNVTPFPADNIFVIDHHCIEKAVPYRSEIRSGYSSCSSIVAKLLSDEGFDYNKDKKLATALYYGLYTDSGGMNEINHPADKDLRDLTNFDEITINILKNSNLSLEEMKIAGDALKHYKYNDEFAFAVVEAQPCDPNILGFISDLLLQVDKVDTCLVFCRMPFAVKLSVRSCVNDIKANELAEFITDGKGSGGGHAQKAGGYLPLSKNQTDIMRFICERMSEYHKSYTVIHSNAYNADISAMKKYQKLPLAVGYVKSTDLISAGTEICVRTLEADLNVTADDNLYIMVGVSGEAYPIKKEKFLRSYTETAEAFTPETEYKPTVINKKEFSAMNLLPHLKACRPTGNSFIYAKELNSTVKVYTSWDKCNYMLGRKGDYIAVRSDDLHDVYIIERKIFGKTYTECR